MPENDSTEHRLPPGTRVASEQRIIVRTVREGLTRAEVADVLRVSTSTVRRLERDGELHPTGGRGEERRFDEDEVRALARRRNVVHDAPDAGERASLAFALYAKDVSVREVVQQLRITASEACALYEDFRRCGELGGPLLVSRTDMSELAKMALALVKEGVLGCWYGEPKDGAALIAWLRDLLTLVAETERTNRSLSARLYGAPKPAPTGVGSPT